jgi:hypothetical protein
MPETPDEPLTGTWMHRAGTRVEVSKDNGTWYSQAFMSRHGGTGSERTVHTDPVELRQRLANLETQGYVKQVIGQPEPGPLPGQTIGVIMIAIAILVVFVLIAAS